MIWSSSWVLIKFGLQDIPALTFAGLRYFLAFICLLPFTLRPMERSQITRLRSSDWLRLLLLGFLYIAVVQGTQFIGLSMLPATNVSLMLSFTSVIVAVLGFFFLSEIPGRLQVLGIAANIAGILIFFYPVQFTAEQALGLLVVTAGVVANAVSSVMGRSANRSRLLSPLSISTIEIGVGSILLLVSSFVLNGLPQISPRGWLLIVLLAVVNTALAFTLWNYTLQTLTAMESSIINSTMLVQIALLAWLFLGENLNARQITGLIIAALGAVFVQIRKNRA